MAKESIIVLSLLGGGLLVAVVGMVLWTLKKKTAYLFIAVIGVVALFSSFLFMPEQDVDNSQSAVVEELNFAECYYAYKENKLRADDTYKGNRYRITCTFSSVGDGGLNGLLGSLSVTAYAYANGTQCVLWCTFDEDTQREALSKLNKGDQFTFEGICDSWGNWSDCKIVE